MSVHLVVSEILSEIIPILDFGQGPTEDYRIIELVVADSREKARYLAWQTDKNFSSYIPDMPNFRTRKLSSSNGVVLSGVVSNWMNYQYFWNHPKVLELFSVNF